MRHFSSLGAVSSSVACLTLAMVAGWVSAALADSDASVFVNSRLPIRCEAGIVSPIVVTLTPLLINASVHQDCNATHDLSLTYTPLSVTAPNLLFITLDGAPPNLKSSGAQTFTGLPPANTDKPLVIQYAGGTLAQRRELARSLSISVVVH